MSEKSKAPQNSEGLNFLNSVQPLKIKTKYTNFSSELKEVREYLRTHNATSTMTAVALDIYRPNLCRHKRKLQKRGLLIETHSGICKETGFTAHYLTTNPDLIKSIRKGGKAL